MLPLSRIAAAALAVCVVGCALTGKSDSQSVDSRRGSSGDRSKTAAADRKGSTRESPEDKPQGAAARAASHKKGTTSESTAAADNPFRRDRPARPTTRKDETSLPSVVPNAEKDDLEFAEFAQSDARGRSAKSAADADPEDWLRNSAPRPKRSSADADLDAMIQEEIRLADPEEKVTLARDLPTLPPHLARQLIQTRRLARQVSAGQNEERLAQSAPSNEASRRRLRSDFEEEGRPVLEPSRDRSLPNDQGTLPNWDRLDVTADTRSRSYPAYPPAPGTLPRALGPTTALSVPAVTPLGDASSFPAPPTSSLWSGTSTGGIGRGTDTGTGREMQQLFQAQAQSQLLRNTGASQGLFGGGSLPMSGPSSQPASGSLFNASPVLNGPPVAGGFSGSSLNTLPARSDTPGLFNAGANFSPLPAPNTTMPTGGRSNILQVSATNAGNMPSAAMQNAVAAVVDPQSGLAAPASRADLQRLIAVAEADAAAARLGPHPSDAERRFYIEKHVALRMLYLMAGQQERALQAIPGIDAGDQEFWQQMFWGVANYFDGQNVPDRGHRAALAATQLRTAVDRLQESAKLELRNVAFCHKIASFGNYERFDRDEFTPNQPVLVYAELSNFKSAPAAGGKYLTRIRSSIEIHDAAGRSVMRIQLKETDDLCLNHRRDYYHSYEFTLPPATKIALGPHTLKLIVEDLLSNKVAEETLRFTVN